MVEVLIGTGGWDYFNVPGDRLRNYARAFKTVEVNSTFYTIPPLSMVESWKRRVANDFEFTVRCNQELTHKLQFKLVETSFELFDCMKRICSILGARILHIQTPATLKLDTKEVDRINDFLSTLTLSGLQLAWEIRTQSRAGRQRLLHILEKHGVVHSIDLSRENPAYESSVIYSRLFGKGIHNLYQFTNVELEEINEKAKKSSAERIYLNFHGSRMYKDAARISVYEATGEFPKVTSGVGVESIIEIFQEDARFPSSTSELARHLGWRVCEWKDDQQLHVFDVLSMIGEKKFTDLSELKVELNKLSR